MKLRVQSRKTLLELFHKILVILEKLSNHFYLFKTQSQIKKIANQLISLEIQNKKLVKSILDFQQARVENA